MKATCPACGRLLFSRKRLTCGYCGEKIPSELRLSSAETAAVKKEINAIKKRREIAAEKEEKARKKGRRTLGNVPQSQAAFILGLPPYNNPI